MSYVECWSQNLGIPSVGDAINEEFIEFLIGCKNSGEEPTAPVIVEDQFRSQFVISNLTPPTIRKSLRLAPEYNIVTNQDILFHVEVWKFISLITNGFNRYSTRPAFPKIRWCVPGYLLMWATLSTITDHSSMVSLGRRGFITTRLVTLNNRKPTPTASLSSSKTSSLWTLTGTPSPTVWSQPQTYLRSQTTETCQAFSIVVWG